MSANYLTTTALVAALAATPMFTAPAQANDAAELIGGALIGGLIGYGIAQSQQPQVRVITPQPQPQPPRAQPTRPRVQPGYTAPQRVVRPSIPATESGRQIQTALNYFGFNAGFVDGQVGPGTRAAIQRYQAALGHPVNGRNFPEYQSQYLIGAHLWATNGGQSQTNLTGTPLLVAYRNVLNGTNQPTYAGNQQPGTTVIVNPGTTATVPPAGSGQPVTTEVAATNGGLPNLFAGASGETVLSAHCSQVAQRGQANGGQMHLGNLTDPSFALSELFCIARGSAVSQGHELTQAVAGFTYDEIATQCQGFSGAIAAQRGLVGVIPPSQAIAATNGFILSSGIPQAELAATARVCLGVGYSSDNLEMAVGSALVLVAAGESGYGELLGHHLREGFGVAADEHRAHEWYEVTLTALQNGAPAVFSPADAGRTPLVRQAVSRVFPQTVTPQPIQTFAPVVPQVAPSPTPAPAPAIAPTPVVIAPAPAPAPVEPLLSPQVVQPLPVVSPQRPEPVIGTNTFSAGTPAQSEPNISSTPNALPTFQVQQ